MKIETDAYVSAAAKTTIEPRYVVELSFDDADTDITYITSHDDALDPGSIAAIDRIDGAIINLSGITQSIKPDTASHSIGNSTVKLLDVNGEISTKIKTKLDGGEGLRKKRIRLYKGETTLTAWSDYSLQYTFLIDKVSYKDGVYALSSADIQRSVKQDIFSPHQGVLTSTISDTATTIPITIADASSKFPLVAHDSIYTSNASATVGYIKIDDEIICHSGWNGGFTELTVVERGALNTSAKTHEVTATNDEQKKKVDELIYLEMAAPKMIYALLTGVLHSQGANLPDHWHLAVATDFVELSDFTGIGDDLWNTSDNTGRIARFIGLEETEAKKFIEKELLLWLACFMPVYSDGKLGLVRHQAALPYSAYDAHMTTGDIISHSELTYDQEAVINNISISWNWISNLKRFTKINTLIDSDSITKHGSAKQRKYEFKGVFTGVHSDEDIRNYFRAILNRYSSPPLRLKIKVMPQWDRLEVGDTVRVTLPSLWDYHIDDSLDRVFEIQGIKTDWITGQVTLDLFGGVERSAVEPIASSNVMQDSFYTATGTELSTVLTISGGAVTASGTLTGGAGTDDAVYYYDGDLTINSGVVVTMTRNAKLLVKGFLTVNGDIDITGLNTDSGYLGKTNSGRAAHVDVQEAANDDGQVQFALIRTGYAALSNTGQNEVPEFNLLNPDGLSIQGLPTNLTGRRGVLGQVATMKQIAGANTAGTGAGDYVASQTSTRGAGGGGCIIISRGGAIGGSGSFTTDSESGGLGSSLVSTWTPARTVHSQRGASGFPGGVLWLIDGDYTAPIITSSNFSALRAAANPPAAADEFAPSDGSFTSLSSSEEGYGLVPVDNFNYYQSCSRVQYLPNPVEPFDWLPADEEQQATGYENKPPTWSEVVDDGAKPADFANFIDLSNGALNNASVVFNPGGGLVGGDGRPAGVLATYGSSVQENISYQDASKTIVMLQSDIDADMGCAWPAFRINTGTTYTIFIRIRSDAAAVSGAYFRIEELDIELSQSNTHVGNSTSEAGVQQLTREITTFHDNQPIGTAWEEYVFTYTPTATAIWASPLFLNWTGMGNNELHIDTCLVVPDSDKTSINTALNTSNVRDVDSGLVSAAGTAAFLNGMEAEEFDDWVDDSNNTISVESTDTFTGAQAMRVATTSLSTDASGSLEAVKVLVPERISLAFAGKKIRVNFYAKTDDGASFFQAAYSTNGAGDSGWRQFEVTTSWAPYYFEYLVSDTIVAGGDYIGIQAATDGEVLFDNVVVTVSETSVNLIQVSNWQEQTNPKAFDLFSIAYGEGYWFAAGEADGTDAYMIYSEDGHVWTEQANPKNFEIRQLECNGTHWVGVGVPDGTDSYLITSSDLEPPFTFTERSNPKNGHLNGVAYGNGIWVAVGLYLTDGTDAYIITATDPTGTWTERSNPKEFELRDITFAEGLFVAVGSGDGTDSYVVTSPDGINWTERSIPGGDNALRAVTHGNGLFVAVGISSPTLIVTSPDGINWTKISETGRIGSSGQGVTYGNGLFVVTTNGGEIIRSIDGVDWERVPYDFGANVNWEVAYADNRFVIVGRDFGGDAQIFTSLIL